MCRLYCLIILHVMCTFCYGQQRQPPQFVHPPNPTLIYGIRHQTTEIKINCEAKGHPAVKYRWLKNNQDLERQGHPLTIHATGLLSLPFSGDDQAGLYQCVAYNDYGSAYDRPVRIEIAHMDRFPLTRREIVQVVDGSAFHRVCKAPSSNPPPNTYWILRRSQKHLSFMAINSSNIVTNDIGTLFFQRVSEQEIVPEYYYTCVAENPVLRDYKFGPEFAFGVRNQSAPPAEPSIQYSSPKVIFVEKGADLNLYCLYTGRDLAIVWKKNGAPLPPRQVSHEVQSNGKVLRLKTLEAFDDGEYSCTFPDAPLLDRQFNVTIDEPPYWKTSAPKSVTSNTGDTVEYDCSTAGKPTTSIKFYRNGAELRQNENYQINGSKLKIVNVKSGNVAVYQCNASNAHGYVWSNFYLNLPNN